MSQPTYDDANLLLKLYELRTEAKMRDARNWFFGSFKCKTMAEFGQLCPPGSATNAYYRQCVSYWDMASSFVTAGVLNPDLFFANTREVLFVWERVKPIIADVRDAYKDPNYLGNLEKAGKACAEWVSKTSGEEAYKAFAARVG
ncbi:MAG TPA: hypothetical protein VGJ09_16770 [Bryobacteraceae bacterium]|jgi:hypothetical protein